MQKKITPKRISIWYRPENGKPEKIDTATTRRQADYLVGEYRLAFGCLPGQQRHGKDKVWAGRKSDEPPAEPGSQAPDEPRPRK